MAKRENVFKRFENEKQLAAEVYKRASVNLRGDFDHLNDKSLKEMVNIAMHDGTISKGSAAYKVLAFFGLNKGTDTSNALQERKSGGTLLPYWLSLPINLITKSGVGGLLVDIAKPVLVGQGIALGRRLLLSGLKSLNPFSKRRRKRKK